MTTRLVIVLLLILSVSAHAQWEPNGIPISLARNSAAPQLVSDGAGGAVIAWIDARAEYFTITDVYAQRVTAAGATQWTVDGIPVCDDPAEQGPFVAIPDGSDGVILVWADSRNGARDIYAQRVDASGVPQWTADGTPLCAAAHEQNKPVAIPDGSGGAIIAWHDVRNGSNADIYAQRIDASGVAQWTVDGIGVCTLGDEQREPVIVPDGTDGAVIAWGDRRGADYDIYAQHVDGTGAVTWTAGGVALCTSGGIQANTVAVSDGSGGAIVCWSDNRSGAHTYDVYAQRVNATGAVQWTTDGVALCTAVNEQYFPKIATDACGGAFVAWEDFRSITSETSLYAQHVDASGVVLWAADGIKLGSGPPTLTNPAIVADGTGGAVITWVGLPGTAIRAQRVDAAGAEQWTPDGVSVCSVEFGVGYPAIVSDGSGGAVIAWEDGRNGIDPNIYAQHIDGSGTVTGITPPRRSPSLLAARVHPNPFSGTASIAVELGAPANVQVDVFDVAGRKLRTYVRPGAARSHVIDIGDRDDAGHVLPSGIYFCRIRAAGETITRKMAITR